MRGLRLAAAGPEGGRRCGSGRESYLNVRDSGEHDVGAKHV